MVNSSIMICHFRNVSAYAFCLVITISFNAKSQQFLIPETVLIQHAGSIGYFSAGGGYELFQNREGSLDLMWGYIPKSKGGSQHIIAAKFAYRPIRIKVKDITTINLFNPGVFFSYHPGDKYYITLNREQYPKGYYWWSSAIRTHISLGTEFKFNTSRNSSTSRIKYLTIYSEINTNDLYLASYFPNRKQLNISDILKSGFGIKAYFR